MMVVLHPMQTSIITLCSIVHGALVMHGGFSDAAETEMANLAASHGVTVINQSYGDYNAQGRAYLNENMVDIWRAIKVFFLLMLRVMKALY